MKRAPAIDPIRKTFQCWIPGKIPSKKNGWKNWKGRTIVDPAMKAVFLGIKLRLLSARNAQRITAMTSCEVNVEFHMSSLRSDIDNGIQSILDCLKESGVIENDSAKHVRVIRAEVFEVKVGDERAGVTVTGVEASRRGDVA